MKPGENKKRRGLTLLELVISCSMLAILLTAMSTALRTGRQAWEAHQGDASRLEAQHGVLRHIVRQARQATSVSAVTAEGVTTGSLSLKMPDQSIVTWSRDSANQVWYGTGGAIEPLAADITHLSFTGYKADGQTTTTVPAEIRSLRISVGVQLPREVNGAKTLFSLVWIRSWQ
ncbi:MAG: prepilin-type N-terminal cleavage/methylation domain-containing protein [Pirellulales bacterium]|nr:prepilin-type N-terminal cleavage/methylation domain-containing protein [Pirellulales bacterium]